MTFALFGILGNIICWKWGDWKNWKKYYPTMLYFTIGELVEEKLFHYVPLWGYGQFIEHYPVLDVAMMLILYPCTVILFFTWYPKPLGKQCLYNLLWVGIYLAIEAIAYKTGGFIYHNGWSIWHSLLFNMFMFPLLALHHKKPLLVWPISAALCFLLLYWFHVPFYE